MLQSFLFGSVHSVTGPKTKWYVRLVFHSFQACLVLEGKTEEGGYCYTENHERTYTRYNTVLHRIGSFGEGGGACATLSKSPHGLSVGLCPNRGIAGGLSLCQLPLHSLLRPPPNIHSIFDLLLVPQSPPTINTIDTKSTLASPLSSPFPTRPRTMHGAMCTYGTSLLAGSLILHTSI